MKKEWKIVLFDSFFFDGFDHTLIKIILDTGCRLSEIYMCFVHNNPEAEAQKPPLCLQRESIQRLRRNSFGLLPQGYCERNTHKSWKDDI